MVIIGGGQAGLAMSYHLRQRGREHVVLERYRIGERWRTERWDSLHFQLPNVWLELPGKRYAGSDPDGFTHHSDVVRFITDYADEIAAPVRTGIEVTRLGVAETGDGYALETSSGSMTARHVVIATGPFQKPAIPAFSAAIPSSVYQIDSSHYRNPNDLPKGSVLVIGSGNSGCQIADELLHQGRHVYMSVSRHKRVPRRYRGQDVIWWYDRLGYFDIPIDNFPGRRPPPTTIMTGMDGGYDLDPAGLGRKGVTLLGRVLGVADGSVALHDDAAPILAAADNNHANFLEDADSYLQTANHDIHFEPSDRPAPLLPPKLEDIPRLDLSKHNISAIIWANGHNFSFDWVKLPVIDPHGAPIQQRGITTSRGVYFLGLHWMHTFRSAIFPFMGRDAAYLADHIEQHYH